MGRVASRGLPRIPRTGNVSTTARGEWLGHSNEVFAGVAGTHTIVQWQLGERRASITDSMITRGFHGRRSERESKRLPPGQHETRDFPVLSAGPTPHTPLDAWTFTLEAEDGTTIASWGWQAFQDLGATEITADVHCVTRWSKFDTVWRGVSVDRILSAAGLDDPPAPFVMAFCDGGYTTNLPVEDVLDGKASVVWDHDGEPLAPEHGGPARLLVPHLYFWKSAKWIRGLRFMDENEPGFWEVNGYHHYGDPWREQRYDSD
jgi:DMSO/TMAO reductase YedYZ molybdopterin-dependent catalytic subunit